MLHSRYRGLSLLEVMTTMAITVILLGIAVPVLGGLIKQNRLTSQINNLRSSLSLTRSSAAENNVVTVICKSHDGKNCSQQGDWHDGWIIFLDTDNNRRVSGKESPFLVQSALPEATQVSFRAFGSRNYIAYRPSGLTRTNGTFTICTQKSPDRARALILNKSGRVRLSKTMPGGKTIKCGKNG